MIEYVLHENHLPSSPNTFSATVRPSRTAGLEDVVAYMRLHGTTAAPHEILATLEDYFSAIEEMVLDGQSVNTPNARYRVAIKGKFAGLSDGFEPDRHRIVAAVSPGPRFRQAIASQARPVKERAIKPRPFPEDYFDQASGERNGKLTPGGMGQLVGDNLRFDPADPAQGVFLRAADGSVRRVETLGKNMPGELIFLVPALPAGEYKLEVCATLTGNVQVRTGLLEATLQVV